MEILVFFDQFCKRNNLKYSLAYGTLIGAARHKGFIPWDDDVDLGVERQDYERFIATCEDLLPEHVKLRTYKDDSYHHYYYARIVDTRYHIRRKGSTKERIEELWIDIFPLDGMPNGMIVSSIHKSKLLFTRLLYHTATFDRVNLKRPGRPLLDRMIIRFLLVTRIGKSLDSKKLLDRIDALLKKYPTVGSGYEFNFMGSTHAFREIFSKEIFGKNTKYQFEDMMLVGPKDYDSYLKKLYGDYMKLPPVEERNIHAEEFVEGV